MQQKLNEKITQLMLINTYNMDWISDLPLHNPSTNIGVPTDIETYKIDTKSVTSTACVPGTYMTVYYRYATKV